MHCLRRVDGDKHYPEDLDPRREVHADGELWSAALWRARGLVRDPEKTDRIIIEAQFDFAPDTSFQDAARATIATAAKYGAGPRVPARVHRARLHLSAREPGPAAVSSAAGPGAPRSARSAACRGRAALRSTIVPVTSGSPA